MINIKEDARLSKLNHSCAHLLAQAVKHLYPEAKFWVGPVIEEGFYYDIDLGDDVITETDLDRLEHEMKKISKDGKRIVRHELSKEDALDMFKNDSYKIDLDRDFEIAPGDVVKIENHIVKVHVIKTQERKLTSGFAKAGVIKRVYSKPVKFNNFDYDLTKDIVKKTS